MEGSVDVPWTPAAAVVTLAGGWMEERFVDGPAPDPAWERRWARATLRRWMTPALRLGASAGLERWADRGRVGRFGVSALAASSGEGVRAGAELAGWTGGGEGFARVRGALRLRHRPTEGRAWTLTAGASLASADAPPTVWDGAGTGRIRAPLLRGHRLVRDGRMGGDAFGRGLLHATLGHAWSRSLGPAHQERQCVYTARAGTPEA